MANLIANPLPAEELIKVLQTTEGLVAEVFQSLNLRYDIVKHGHKHADGGNMEESVLISLKSDIKPKQIEECALAFTALCRNLGYVMASDMRMKPGETLISVEFLSDINRKTIRNTLIEAFENKLGAVNIVIGGTIALEIPKNGITPDEFINAIPHSTIVTLKGNDYILNSYKLDGFEFKVGFTRIQQAKLEEALTLVADVSGLT